MPPPTPAAPRTAAARGVRLLLIALVLESWFGTQALLARRPAVADGSGIGDGLFTCTATLNAFFAAHPAAANALPTPPGMIWHSPGFPSLLVTYGTTSDFFFSGHTAIAVYGATELARLGRRWLTAVGIAVAAVEAATVVVLRAHYTMEVFTGIVTALWISGVAARLAPPVDRAMNHLVGSSRR